MDAFLAGLPIVSLAKGDHSPEVAYLENGKNGCVVESEDPTIYAQAVAELLLDEPKLRRMRAACLVSAKDYSLEKMVEAFKGGILLSLERIQ